ncbi:ExbD/TolR family protein [Pendulispora albinea]|uniref:Biopolymer transporter ExbD n=1 Tax=Pendulispora albinea TaxID=2741071 RepID=A0ABZ2LPR1_9BACT
MRTKPIHIREPVQANSEINVTPLVDIVLVLLIIFMVVTPLLEKDIAVRVPNSEKAETVSEVPPDQIIVHVKGDNKVDINMRDVEDGDYVSGLKARLDPKTNAADKVVFFVAEDKANYGRLVWAIDGAKLAGAETIGIATEPLN